MSMVKDTLILYLVVEKIMMRVFSLAISLELAIKVNGVQKELWLK